MHKSPLPGLLFLLTSVLACNVSPANKPTSNPSGLRDADAEVKDRDDSDNPEDDQDYDDEDSDDPDFDSSERRGAAKPPRRNGKPGSTTDQIDNLQDGHLDQAASETKISSDTSVSPSTSTATTISTNANSSTGTEKSPCIEAPSDWICQVEVEIANLVNKERKSARRSELTFDPKMSWVSRLWSAEQSKRGIISHEWFSSGELKQAYVKKFGEDPGLSAENVAMTMCDSDAKATAASFMRSWMSSPGHRENILRSGQTRLGVGVAKVFGSCFGTQNFGF